MTSPAPLLLEARNLTKLYGSSRAVDDVSLTLHRGETLGLVGESGSGKSTVARILLRLIEPTSGELLFHPLAAESSQPEAGSQTSNPLDLLHLDATGLRRLRRRMAIVFQDPYAALNPRMSVRDILAEPFFIHREQPAQGLQPRLLQLLSEVGLPASALTRHPHEFSGGQRQRINIARALALRPDLLILDEPVSALDVSVAAQVVNLLRDLQTRHGLTMLFISHSMPLVRYLCDRIVVMQRGRIVETGLWNEVCNTPGDPYTQQLLTATPQMPSKSALSTPKSI